MDKLHSNDIKEENCLEKVLSFYIPKVDLLNVMKVSMYKQKHYMQLKSLIRIHYKKIEPNKKYFFTDK
jgi:hypothetical protein